MAIERQCKRKNVARITGQSLTALSTSALLLVGQTLHAQQADTTASGTIPDQNNTAATQGAGVQRPGNGGAPRSPWRFDSGLTVEETYSDNINLAPRGQERSDVVSTISPNFRVTRYGPWLTFYASYNPQLLYYARGSNGSYIRNYLDSNITATLVQNFLFFDAQSSITQQNVSPFGTQAAGTVNGSSNTAETRTVSFGPTLRSRFGNDLSYSAGYRYQTTSSQSDAIGDTHSSNIFAQFQSGTSYRNLGYQASYSRTDQYYGNTGGELIVQSVSNGLTYILTPTVRLRANIGYDDNKYPTTGQPDLKGTSYSGGGDWNPSQHTSLSVLLGHRYFGPTANVSFQETRTRWSLGVSYTRDQRTSQGSGLALVNANPYFAQLDAAYQTLIPDPTQRFAAIEAYLTSIGLPSQRLLPGAFVSNQLFVETDFNATLGLQGLRNTVTFNVFRTQSQALSNFQTEQDVFNEAQKFRQTGYSANWTHKLGPHTTATLSFTKTHNTALQGTGDTRLRTISLTATRQLSKKVSASASIRNSTQTADSADQNGNFFSGNYRENQLRASLHVNF